VANGFFDITLLPARWFDETVEPPAWFSEELGTSGPVTQTITAPFVGSLPSGPVLVQKKTYASTADATTHTLTFDSTPVEGNTLLIVVNSNDVVTTPAGWTRDVTRVDFVECNVYRKVAGASESASVVFTIASTDSFAAVGFEYTKLTGAVDKTQSSVLQGGSSTISTGATATTASANQLIIAGAAWQANSGRTVNSWDNSFTEEGEVATTNAVSNNMGLSVATKVVAATGSFIGNAAMSANNASPHDVGVIATFPYTPSADSDDVVYSPTVVAGGDPGQSLTAPLLSNSSTVYSPTVVPGNITVTAPLLSNSNTVYGPTVIPGNVSITAPLLSNSSTVYGPTVLPGSVQLTAPLVSNSSTVHGPTVVPGAVQLTAPLITNVSDVYSPTVVPAGANVTAPLIGATNDVYGPTVVPGNVTLTAPLVTNSSTVYGPSVVPGGVTLTAPYVVNSSTVYGPSVVPGNVTLTAPLVINNSTVFGPTVVPGNASITAPLISSTSNIFPGQLNLEIVTGFVDNQSIVYSPLVGGEAIVIAAPLVTNTNTFYNSELYRNMLYVQRSGQRVSGTMKIASGGIYTGTAYIYKNSQWQKL
jgi:hypothetical protein